MVQLRNDLEEIEAAGLQVVVISYDEVEVLEKFSAKKDIDYLMLSDEGSATIDAYGIRDADVEPGTRGDGIPYPGTFIVGTDGKVKGKLFIESARMRHRTESLVQMAGEVL